MSKISNCDIYVAQSKIPNAGYGVFANRDFKKGDIIERAPFLEVDTPYGNELMQYVFQSHLTPNKSIIVFGYGSIYNHSLHPNIIYSISPKLPSDRLFTYQAFKNIKKGDELYINYGKDHPINQYTKHTKGATPPKPTRKAKKSAPQSTRTKARSSRIKRRNGA